MRLFQRTSGNAGLKYTTDKLSFQTEGKWGNSRCREVLCSPAPHLLKNRICKGRLTIIDALLLTPIDQERLYPITGEERKSGLFPEDSVAGYQWCFYSIVNIYLSALLVPKLSIILLFCHVPTWCRAGRYHWDFGILLSLSCTSNHIAPLCAFSPTNLRIPSVDFKAKSSSPLKADRRCSTLHMNIQVYV